MEITDLTDEILSDDYEEGEILDEDTLYDNVSSLEEFSASDTDLKSYGEINSVVFKKSLLIDGRKEKHHRRKEHKCKEDSICRKERSGKHCYARIRKSKFTAETAEKAKIVDAAATQEQEIQKKKGAAVSLVHAAPTKYPRHVPFQRDLQEKENRCGHKYLRYYDYPRLGSNRVDRKQFSEKLKKHLTNESNSKNHENRKRTTSQSPKLFLRSHMKELSIPKGTSSLLKRLVGSGSIGLKTHKDIEEIKKSENCSVIVVNEDSIKEPEAVNCNLLESDSVNSQNVSHHEDPLRSEKQKVIDELPIISTQNDCMENYSEGILESEIKLDPSIRNSLSLEHSENEIMIEIPSSKKGNSDEVSIDKLGNINNDNTKSNEKVEIVTSQDEISHNNEQDIHDDIDELHLRLEALRTAMLRKHKERKKRGFICRKKSTAEDDSFAEYILSHIDRDNSNINQEEECDIVGNTYSCEESVVNKFLGPKNITINQDENKLQDNLLENCSYSSNYSIQNNFTEGQDLSPAFLSNEQQLSMSETKNFFESQNLIKENSIREESVEGEHCLKEINSNDVPFIGRNKRVKKISGRFSARRKDLLYNKKLYSKSILKKRLERRDYKRRRREMVDKDLKILNTDKEEEEINNEDESDEERALRELALKSVKEREKHKNLNETFTFQEKNEINSNDISEINDGSVFSNLHIEIDNNTNVNPLISGGSETTNVSSNLSLWDEIDEDILRAQLLSSLSSKIPTEVAESSAVVTRFSKKQIKALKRNKIVEHPENRLKQTSLKLKENLKKNSKIKSDSLKKKILRSANNFRKETARSIQTGRQVTQEVPIVPKFIISLTEDSSSEEEEEELTPSIKMEDADVVKCIDLFLQEARIENDLKQGLLTQESDFDPKQCGTNNPIKVNKEKESLPDIGCSTPQVLKHLPAWQQEEYRRLKQKIAEKEKQLKAAKEKIIFPYESDEILKERNISQNTEIKNNVNAENYDIEATKIGSEEVLTEEIQDISEVNERAINNVTNEIKSLVEEEQSKNIMPKIKSLLFPPSRNTNFRLGEEINNMAKCVEHLEKEMESFRRLNEEIVQKKKELLVSKLNMAKKKKLLFEIKKKLLSKEKLIQAKIEQDSLSVGLVQAEQNDCTKQTRRHLELGKLRMREFNLKTRKIFDEIEFVGSSKSMQSSVGVLSVEKPRLSTKAIQTRNLHKRYCSPNNTDHQPNPEKIKNVIKEQPLLKGNTESVAEKSPLVNWDPFVPVCPFDLSGVCKDEECKFQHIKAS